MVYINNGIKSECLSVRPSVRGSGYRCLDDTKYVCFETQWVLVLQMSVIGALPHPENAFKREPIKCHN